MFWPLLFNPHFYIIVWIQMLHGLDGFAHAAETLAGHDYGKRDRVALSSAVKASAFWTIILALMFTVVYAVFGSAIFNSMTTRKAVQNASET